MTPAERAGWATPFEQASKNGHVLHMNSTPKSAYDKTGGMSYFPRMLDKIRLYATGELRTDFHANLGLAIGVDGFCCGFLRIAYSDLKNRVLEGVTDEEILQWCFERGRTLNKIDLMIWNEFIRKEGWNDRATSLLQKLKAESGLADRHDIVTMADYFEVDEGRKPQDA
ncbi:MAG: DUF5069 domain-containing protein [Nitrospira sp.]|nr:DUF5069 domain-containing protein [Nitrospira sp.]